MTHIAEPTASAASRRRRVVVATACLAALLLLLALRQPPGAAAFYPLTFGLAVVLLAGAFIAGPVTASDDPWRRVIVPAVALAVLLFGVFLALRFVVMLVPAADDAVQRILRISDAGIGPLVLLAALVSGVAEEVFFRGSVYDAVGPRPVLRSTVAYASVTAFSLSVPLIAAAGVMGAIFARQRQVSGGVLAPAVTHAVWSLLMILLLPR